MYENAVLPIWSALRQRFTTMAEGLTEDEMDLKLGKTSIKGLLHHTAEVELMFAEWFFGKAKPEHPSPSSTLPELLEFLSKSETHLLTAMKQLPEEEWSIPVQSPMGDSTPLEAVGRLMYHAGIHSGQISLIKKENA